MGPDVTKKVRIRDRHSPWFNHNLELLLWGFTTFAVLILLAQAIRAQKQHNSDSSIGARSAIRMPMNHVGAAPEIGD